jgi:hypothetical protein
VLPLRRPRQKQEINVRMALKGTGCKGVDLICLAHDRCLVAGLYKYCNNIQGLYKGKTVLTT